MNARATEKEIDDKVRIPHRVVIAGVGGAGLNAVAHLAHDEPDGPELIVIDTDGEALNASPIPRHAQIGSGLTGGLSAGGKVDIGRRSANGDYVKVRELFRKTELLFLIAGMGGGTGTGAAPVIAQTAREAGALVIGCVIWPFEVEGPERLALAENGLSLMRRSCNTVIVLPNQSLLNDEQMDMDLAGALAASDRHFGMGLRVIWKLLGQQNLLNVDFAGLANLMEPEGSVCTFIHAEGSGKNKARLAMNRVLTHASLSDDAKMQGVHSVFMGLLGGDDMTLKETHDVLLGLTEKFASSPRRCIGAGIDSTMKNRLSVAVLMNMAREGEGMPPASEGRTAKLERTAKGGEQGEFKYDLTNKGRFKGVEPTLYEGQDLDIPTFLRRGMKLSR